METVFEVRSPRIICRTHIKTEALRFQPKNESDTLWQIMRESKAEAAVRRMNWIEQAIKNGGTLLLGPTLGLVTEKKAMVMPLSQYIDAACPPPPTEETQLDWNTGDPMVIIHSWPLESGAWIASFHSESSLKNMSVIDTYLSLLNGRSAISTFKDAAIANLRAMSALLKPKTTKSNA